MDLTRLGELSPDALMVLSGALAQYIKTDQLQDYRAYPRQMDFHIAGVKYRSRMLKAGNQNGKTFAAGAEMAMHLTGEYPSWWQGYRFPGVITAWAASETAEATRDNPQRALLGLPKQLGTGMIPKRCITPMLGRAKGVSDLYDFLHIRHVSGGVSMLKFRNYSQDREAWQGPPVNFVWFDEEPPEDIYAEGLARTIAVQGRTIMTFTPLKGYTNVVNMYVRDPDPENSDRHLTSMTIHDALHIPPEQIEAEIARWPKHEQRARIYGEPALGEGLIYPYHEDDLKVEPFEIPEHWPQIAAIDFGGTSQQSHPTAAVKLALDPDADCLYVTHEYRKKAVQPPIHWLTLRRWGKDLKWSWPRDGVQEEKGTGTTVMQIYRQEGMKALPMYAQYQAVARNRRSGAAYNIANSVVSVERGIIDIQARAESDGLKIFSTCPLIFEEMRQYHRDDGKIVKVMDDLLDALRYGVMMLRFAEAPGRRQYRRREEINWQVGA